MYTSILKNLIVIVNNNSNKYLKSEIDKSKEALYAIVRVGRGY